MNPQISFITTCKGRLGFLQQSLPRMVAQADAEVIVVDYACPENAGSWVEEHFPGVRVVKVENVRYFVGAHARNLGAAQARAPWLCFVDADILLDPQFSRNLLPQLKAGHFFQAHPMPRQMVGTTVLRQEDFARVGGYDEVIAGWGGEDVDLYGRLLLRGIRQAAFPIEWLDEIPHSDEIRGVNREIGDIQTSHQVNTLYRRAKLDIMRLLSRDVNLEERKALYQEIRATVEKTPPGGWKQIEVTLPSPPVLSLIGGPHTLERKLVLTLKPLPRTTS